MQGSDIEKIERKFAELEFSVREKEKVIVQNYAKVMNRLENGASSSLNMLNYKEKLESLEQ